MEKISKDEAYYGENWSTPTKRCAVCLFFMENLAGKIGDLGCSRLYGRVKDYGRCLEFRERSNTEKMYMAEAARRAEEAAAKKK
jgi:hypothetical protein